MKQTLTVVLALGFGFFFLAVIQDKGNAREILIMLIFTVMGYGIYAPFIEKLFSETHQKR